MVSRYGGPFTRNRVSSVRRSVKQPPAKSWAPSYCSGSPAALWHAYRGGLSLRERLSLPASPPLSSPCDLCADQPCLSACPAQAFRDGSFDLDACVRHVRSSAGTECRENGCLARRACPVGPQFRYTPPQARFHMSALLDRAADTKVQ
jgi:hypothetical protein